MSTWHESGGLRIGVGSTLSFTNCAVSTFCHWDTVTSISDGSLMLRLFGNTPMSAVEAKDSNIEYPCVVRSSQHGMPWKAIVLSQHTLSLVQR